MLSKKFYAKIKEETVWEKHRLKFISKLLYEKGATSMKELFSTKATEKNMKDIVNKLKKSEEEIERGEGIEADIFFRELRQKYDY